MTTTTTTAAERQRDSQAWQHRQHYHHQQQGQQQDESVSKTTVIPIHVAEDVACVDSDKASGIQAWAMLELNGELIMPTVTVAKENDLYHVVGPNGVELGSLQFRNKTTPILIVGSHELKGKLQTLPLPFCVMERCDGNRALDCPNGDKVSYRLVGVIKQKILFDSYPKSILR